MEQGKKSGCFQKGYKISFRIFLNLCNAKFSRIDVEKRVYKKVILSLHFSMASFNMDFVLGLAFIWHQTLECSTHITPIVK